MKSRPSAPHDPILTDANPAGDARLMAAVAAAPCQHTPGPWEAGAVPWQMGQYPFLWRTPVSSHEHIRDREMSVGVVGHVAHGRSASESLANARLIAAAPELLEACKMALIQVIQDNNSRGIPTNELRGTQWQIEAAIAKATT